MIDSQTIPDPALVDVVIPEDGYPDVLAVEDTPDALMACCGEASREFPDSMWIEPRDWPEKARENDKNHTWPMNFIDTFSNQSPTHECTCHSLMRCMTGARNRQRGIIFPDGPKKNHRYEESQRGSVFLSPMSVYNEANPRIKGGANVRQVLEIAVRRGALPDKIQPRDYGFKHSMTGTNGKGNSNQSGGAWVSVKNMPDGWEETAANFKPLEVVIAREWEQAVCLVLHGALYGVGRDGHAIPWALLTFKGDNLTNAGYPDSYDLVRYDSLSTIKRAFSGGFGIVTMTAPDDWLKPGG